MTALLLTILLLCGDLPPSSGAPEPAATPAAPTSTATTRPVSGGSSAPVSRPAAVRRGLATWYCCTRGYSRLALVAAAGPALRVGRWRGRFVTVVAGGRRLRVRLVDWCSCHGGRIIDLHPSAFRRLAPLGVGVKRVTVTW